MLTIFASALHVLPCQIQAPTIKDELGGGADARRRRFTRSLRRWEISMIGAHDKLDPVIGLLDYAQGDTPIWFDGAGFGEITEACVVGFGDGNKSDFALPHRHVFASSMIVYENNAVVSGWAPVGSWTITDSVHFSVPPAINVQITAKYRRRIKVVLETEGDIGHSREFRDTEDASLSVFRSHFFLQEVAT